MNINTKNFIEKAIKVHGNKFDYSDSEYFRANKKIIIKCKSHGIFEQTPNNHLCGHGCPMCSVDERRKRYSFTTDAFIQKASKKHDNFYDYSLVDYKGSFEKVKIICPKHGVFSQSPASHLHGANCSKCVHVISKIETDFLDYIGVKTRNYYLPEWRAKPVDGFDEKTNTIYEFLGDYWHGNPLKYDPNLAHPHRKIKFKDVYLETFHLFDQIKMKGYNIKYIWENDWETWNKIGKPPIKEY